MFSSFTVLRLTNSSVNRRDSIHDPPNSILNSANTWQVGADSNHDQPNSICNFVECRQVKLNSKQYRARSRQMRGNSIYYSPNSRQAGTDSMLKRSPGKFPRFAKIFAQIPPPHREVWHIPSRVPRLSSCLQWAKMFFKSRNCLPVAAIQLKS